MKIIVSYEISEKQISDFLCSALEGGSNYWAKIEDYVEPKKLDFRCDDNNVFKHLDYPLNEDGEVKIKDIETNKIYSLNLKTIEKGLKKCSKLSPSSFSNLIRGDYDSIDADVFLQYCLLGDIIYG